MSQALASRRDTRMQGAHLTRTLSPPLSQTRKLNLRKIKQLGPTVNDLKSQTWSPYLCGRSL